MVFILVSNTGLSVADWGLYHWMNVWISISRPLKVYYSFSGIIDNKYFQLRWYSESLTAVYKYLVHLVWALAVEDMISKKNCSRLGALRRWAFFFHTFVYVKSSRIIQAYAWSMLTFFWRVFYCAVEELERRSWLPRLRIRISCNIE